MEPDGGRVIRYKSALRIGYLRQATAYSEHSYQAMLDKGQAGTLMETVGQLGLKSVREWEDKRFGHLSGGERTKLALAEIWSLRPDMLILDEPTNHMDFQGVEYLVQQMSNFAGTVLVISHDRWFLDQTVTRIIELEAGEAVSYAGNYSAYRDEKERRYQSQLHQYESQEKRERRLEEDIARLKNWSAKAHRDAGKTSDMRMGVKEADRVKAKKKDQQVKSRLKMLEKMRTEGVERPREEARVNFEFDAAGKRGRRIIEVEKLGKFYAGRVLFKDADFFIQRGDRIGLRGPNGCGKTTLLRMIMGNEALTDGELWVSPSVRIGYLSQEVTDLATDICALDYLDARGQGGAQVRTMLANMGFTTPMLEKSIGSLSLGERTRIKLARLILEEIELLILDEPTNHLDLPSREQLEQTLEEFTGTIILVTHDRYLLEKICDKLLVFAEQGIFRSEAGVSEDGQKSAPAVEDKLLLETRLARVLGELSGLSSDDPRYQELDAEFRELTARKQ